MLMLRSMTLKNLATISDTSFEFRSGLNVLTGETGSGKSILVDGLMLATGARADRNMVRPGTQNASVEAVFLGSDGEEVQIRREISARGRSRIFMDDALSTLEEIRDAVQNFVELHSQRSTPVLLKPARQMDLLDRFAGTVSLRDKYSRLFQEYQRQHARMEELRLFLGNSHTGRDLLLHEMSLFDSLNPSVEDYDALISERQQIKKVMEQSVLFQETLASIQGDDGISPILSGLLRRIQREAPERRELTELIAQASISVDEAAGLIYSEITDLEEGPARLLELDNRLDQYSELVSRCGGTVQSMVEYRESIAGQLDEYRDALEEVAEIEKTLLLLAEEVVCTADDLTEKRLVSSRVLAEKAVAELKELNMPWAQFSIRLVPHDSARMVKDRRLDSRGAESVHFVFSANKGIPQESLEAVASGGELSRVALALALVLADSGSASTLIFDEIDAGTGGETAHCLADSLLRAAMSRQIIVISHLAQVASRAHWHLAVNKEVIDDMPVTTVTPLESPQERLSELARLLGGGAGAIDHASRLLEGAQ